MKLCESNEIRIGDGKSSMETRLAGTFGSSAYVEIRRMEEIWSIEEVDFNIKGLSTGAISI